MRPLVIQIERMEERTADTCAFARSPVRVGRNPLSDLQLDESFVSQWHGVIRFDEQRTTYLDLGATNGTLVDGKPIQRNVEVEVSETTDIRIGTLRLHLLRVAAPPELFGARRKSSFASGGAQATNNMEATVFLGANNQVRQQLPPVPPVVTPNDSPAPSNPSSGPRRKTTELDPEALQRYANMPGQQPPPPGMPPLVKTPPPQNPSETTGVQRTPRAALRDEPVETRDGPMATSGIKPNRLVPDHPFLSVPPVVTPSPQQRPASADRNGPTPLRPVPTAPPRADGDLDATYRDFLGVRARFMGAIRKRLESAHGPARTALIEGLLRSYPELANEPEFQLSAPARASQGASTDMTDWLRRLTGGLFPQPGSDTGPNHALALERVGAVLEVFSNAFIELRSAYEQFCEEMALEKPAAESLLNSTKNPRAVLAYLLNPDTSNHNKVDDLARALADFAVHQVALVSAVVEGAREVLHGLSPAQLTGRTEKPSAGMFSKLLGNDQRELWTRYVSAYDETVDEDHFTRKLFGRGFARKYYAITGGQQPRTVPPKS